jgi:hypothetical protein
MFAVFSSSGARSVNLSLLAKLPKLLEQAAFCEQISGDV